MSRRYELSEAVQEQWGQYLRAPSAESFLALRQAVAVSSDYDDSSLSIREADELLEEGKVEEARGKLRTMMPNWLLSPRAHKMASYALYKAGHLRSAAIELRLGIVVRQGILWTGKGTEEQPYLVLHSTDEQDVLEHLDKLPSECGFLEKQGKSLDVWNCRDGSNIWFDRTQPVATA